MELNHITEFINSPAFPLMSENVRKETIAKQKELATAYLQELLEEHIAPVAKKYGLVANLTIENKKLPISETNPIQTETVKEEPKDSRQPQSGHIRGTIAPRTGLCIYLRDGRFIQESKASDTFCEAIKVANPEKVKSLGLMLDKYNIVLNSINYPYPVQPHPVVPGYFANTHSNTAKKKQLLERISDALHLGWRIEIVE